MSGTSSAAAMFLIGMVVGRFLPAFPEPFGVVNQFLPLLLIALALLLFVRG
ncbi:MAG: hypothetical protein J4203_03240 [Candidatus Diapherotrites archaeon]|uniref:Uncharacterized protein n=1 Tax=Candidatus Iainarchaeum sp. TaxID=3101447 RepID=A0A8T4LA94_9ARCH|nr:hypothetical protein [Candidatus Diapherotrites archaeon]